MKRPRQERSNQERDLGLRLQNIILNKTKERTEKSSISNNKITKRDSVWPILKLGTNRQSLEVCGSDKNKNVVKNAILDETAETREKQSGTGFGIKAAKHYSQQN